MPINKNELTKEQIQKAMACETADELMALAKAEGIELTKEEAESYLAELEDFELDGDETGSWRWIIWGLQCERVRNEGLRPVF